jgi:hypothetical protein
MAHLGGRTAPRHAAVAEKYRAIEKPFRKVEIVRGHDDDGAVASKGPKACQQASRRRIVEASERLVEQ